MSSTSSSGGCRTCSTALEFGITHVVMPKGRHEATIVWLHGLGDDGFNWKQILASLPMENIKWVCPTAPTRRISVFVGFPGAAWFDPKDILEDSSPDDLEGLNASAAHVANLLLMEPPDVKLGIGGFSVGAAAALYTATCYILDQNAANYRVRFLDNLLAVVVLSGWLPRIVTMKSLIAESNDTVLRVKALPLLLCHGSEDDVVSYEHGEKAAYILRSSGFQNLTLKTFDGVYHDTCDQELFEMCWWLTDNMRLQGVCIYAP